MITDELREKWFCLKATGRVLEYMGLDASEEVYIIIDRGHIPDKDGRIWSHLTCTNLEALHTFVKNVGGKRVWFQEKPKRPHYDLYGKPKDKALDILSDHIMFHKSIIEFCDDFHSDYKGNPNFKRKLIKQ